jgi:hypothetical protein
MRVNEQYLTCNGWVTLSVQWSKEESVKELGYEEEQTIEPASYDEDPSSPAIVVYKLANKITPTFIDSTDRILTPEEIPRFCIELLLDNHTYTAFVETQNLVLDLITSWLSIAEADYRMKFLHFLKQTISKVFETWHGHYVYDLCANCDKANYEERQHQIRNRRLAKSKMEGNKV